MMLESSGEVSQWDYDVIPGDVIVFPKSVEQEGHFTGHSRYATITLGEDEIVAHMAGEPALENPQFWASIYRFRPTPSIRQATRAAITTQVRQLCEGTVPRSPAGSTSSDDRLSKRFSPGLSAKYRNMAKDETATAQGWSATWKTMSMRLAWPVRCTSRNCARRSWSHGARFIVHFSKRLAPAR
ncbi:hypothetical protein [Borborobacter arsenicus]|uniref:hypothetical protein n=1 Tax=Borborobacter arsenicus TaxID=1851146 RepID=UPI001FE21DED|nr:hypothetical protein [Pseudaminobacter arsenicus]